MIICEQCDHYYVCADKQTNNGCLGKCPNFKKEQYEKPQGERAERALAIIDRLRTDGHINNKEQGTLRRAILLPERPQGEWIEYNTACHHYKCDQCNADYNSFMVKPNFCPNCGAKMGKGGADMRGGNT